MLLKDFVLASLAPVAILVLGHSIRQVIFKHNSYNGAISLAGTVALGTSIIVYPMYFLSFVGMSGYYALILWVICGIQLFILLLSHIKNFRAFIILLKSTRFQLARILLPLSLVGPILLYFIYSFIWPIRDWDASYIYLPVARAMWSTGSMPLIIPNHLGEFFMKMPGAPLLYAFSFVPTGDNLFAISLLPLLYFAATIFLVYNIAKEVTNSQDIANISAILFAFTPAFGYIFFYCARYPDLVASFFAVASLFFVIRWLKTLSRDYILFALLTAMTSFFFKETGAISIGIILYALLFNRYVRSEQGSSPPDTYEKKLKWEIFFLLIVSFAVGTWLLRNSLLIGTPFDILRIYLSPTPSHLSAFRIQNEFVVSSTHFASGEGSHLVDWFQTIAAPLVNYFFNPFLLVFLILGLLISLKSYTEGRLLHFLFSLIPIVTGLWLALLRMSMRYVIIEIVPLVIIAAVGINYLGKRFTRMKYTSMMLTLSIALLPSLLPSIAQQLTHAYAPFEQLTTFSLRQPSFLLEISVIMLSTASLIGGLFLVSKLKLRRISTLVLLLLLIGANVAFVGTSKWLPEIGLSEESISSFRSNVLANHLGGVYLYAQHIGQCISENQTIMVLGDDGTIATLSGRTVLNLASSDGMAVVVGLFTSNSTTEYERIISQNRIGAILIPLDQNYFRNWYLYLSRLSAFFKWAVSSRRFVPVLVVNRQFLLLVSPENVHADRPIQSLFSLSTDWTIETVGSLRLLEFSTTKNIVSFNASKEQGISALIFYPSQIINLEPYHLLWFEFRGLGKGEEITISIWTNNSYVNQFSMSFNDDSKITQIVGFDLHSVAVLNRPSYSCVTAIELLIDCPEENLYFTLANLNVG